MKLMKIGVNWSAEVDENWWRLTKIDKNWKSCENWKNGRLEKIGRLYNNGIIILDYAHTPDALRTCIKNVKEQFKIRKINLVFGCGGERDKPKRKIMGIIADKYCDGKVLSMLEGGYNINALENAMISHIRELQE